MANLWTLYCLHPSEQETDPDETKRLYEYIEVSNHFLGKNISLLLLRSTKNIKDRVIILDLTLSADPV